MDAETLFKNIQQKKSYLCVGLDSDIEKIPTHLKDEEDSIFLFNKGIIDNTHENCVAYKINTAFYEALGTKGWEFLTQTANYIKSNHPEIFLIADAKRGDIGNTSKMYAKAFFEQMPFDAITVAPYMGKDSIEPFLQFPGKWTIILGLTSNKGSFDFQHISTENQHKHLYEEVIKTSSSWGNPENTMFVVGATQAEQFESIRNIVPGHFLLVPGIGAQGGSLEKVSDHGMNDQCGLLVNSSRSIIFNDSSKNFAKAAKYKAKEMQQSMETQLKKHKLIQE
jgi:orotidine-5'-phosphate decarboxylase